MNTYVVIINNVVRFTGSFSSCCGYARGAAMRRVDNPKVIVRRK